MYIQGINNSKFLVNYQLGQLFYTKLELSKK